MVDENPTDSEVKVEKKPSARLYDRNLQSIRLINFH